MFGYSADGAEPSFPAEWRPEPAPEPRAHQYGPDGTCWKCAEPGRPGVHFLDATGPCPGIRSA